MARLPTAADFDRQTPTASVTNAGYTPTGGDGLVMVGKALGGVADSFQAEAEKRQKEQDDLEAAHVNTEFTLGYADMMNGLQSDSDFKNLPNKYKEQSGKLINTLVSQVSPRNQKMMQAKLLQAQAAGYDNALNLTRSKQYDYINTDVARSSDELGKRAITSKSVGEFDLYLKPLELKVNAAVNAGAMKAEEGYKFLESKKAEWAKLQWESTPAAVRLDAIKKASEGGATVTIKDYGADTVKPYTPQRIAQIQKLVNEPSEYDALFEEAGNKYGIDPKELKLRAVVESGLNAKAQAKATPYGQSGGLMQLEVGTAKSLGVTDRNDPRQSVMGAAKLLAKHKEKAGDNQDMLDRLYYAGSEKNMGKNTEQYAENLRAARNGGGFTETGTIFDYMSPEDKIRALNAKDTVTQSALDNVMATNPTEFLNDLSTGKYSTLLNAAETEKYKENAVGLINKQTKQADEIRIAQGSVYNKDAYDKIQAAVAEGDAAKGFALVSELRQSLVDSGKSPQFADDMRAQLLRTNPYSEEEKADILIGLVDRYTELKDKGDEANIDEVARLQNDLMVAKLSGVSGVGSYVNKLAPIISAASKKELGNDDIGWSFFGISGNDPSEPYDSGYQLINDYLFKQGKENDTPLKAKMLTEFIARADKIPEDVMKDAIKRDAALATISNQVIKNASPQSKNIPLPDIKILKDNPTPENRKYFDETYGGGASSRVLGDGS